ncbi:MAG: AraC family transcriptional regulator [Chloroflexota bacterium]
MDNLLQPFPKSFSRGTEIFLAASGELTGRDLDHMHRHNFYELVLLREGQCTFFSDFEYYPAQQGTLIFISPGQLHDYIVEGDPCKLYIFGFQPTILPTVAHHMLNVLPFDDTHRNPVLNVPDEVNSDFLRLFSSAHSRFDGQCLGWDSIITSYLHTILTEAAYLMPQEIIDQSTKASVQLTREFQHELELHYIGLRQVQDYADKLGVTSNYLVKTVRETTSMTPKQMLQNRLLLEAKRLLVHTPYSVSQISDLLQFPSNTTFSRWFRKTASQSPSDFRITALSDQLLTAKTI